MPKSRLIYIDIASGIMVMWVMVFHAIYPMFGRDDLKVIPWFYYFMPWFFYKAGIMFKKKDCKTEWKSSARKLLFTFAIWSFIGYLAHIGWHLFEGDLTFRNAIYSPARSLLLTASVPLNGALWFLPILFLVRGIGNWLLNIRLLWFGCITGLSFAIILLFVRMPLLPAYISGTAWGLFFFATGYWLRDKETNIWVAIVAGIGFIASLFTDIPSVYCGVDNMTLKILWYPACVCGCVTFDNVCRFLDSAANYIKEITHLNLFCISKHVGRNAMNYYAPHKIIFHIGFNIIIFYRSEWYDTWQGLLIVLAAYAIILPYINYIVNQSHATKSVRLC